MLPNSILSGGSKRSFSPFSEISVIVSCALGPPSRILRLATLVSCTRPQTTLAGSLHPTIHSGGPNGHPNYACQARLSTHNSWPYAFVIRRSHSDHRPPARTSHFETKA